MTRACLYQRMYQNPVQIFRHRCLEGIRRTTIVQCIILLPLVFIVLWYHTRSMHASCLLPSQSMNRPKLKNQHCHHNSAKLMHSIY